LRREGAWHKSLEVSDEKFRNAAEKHRTEQSPHTLAVDEKKPSDAALAAEISRRVAEAKARMHELMIEHGLKSADGWTIIEDLRSRPEYTEYIFRPIHRRLPAPELKTSVAIDFEGRPVEIGET
jgi:hypothetical protein